MVLIAHLLLFAKKVFQCITLKYITYVQYILKGVSTLLMYIIVTNVEFLVSENINIYLFLFLFYF